MFGVFTVFNLRSFNLRSSQKRRRPSPCFQPPIFFSLVQKPTGVDCFKLFRCVCLFFKLLFLSIIIHQDNGCRSVFSGYSSLSFNWIWYSCLGFYLCGNTFSWIVCSIFVLTNNYKVLLWFVYGVISKEWSCWLVNYSVWDLHSSHLMNMWDLLKHNYVLAVISC